MQAVYAFPLRLRNDCIGALNLYREQPRPFDDEDVRMAQAFAAGVVESQPTEVLR